MPEPFEYVRRVYRVPAELNREVVLQGRPGVIAADRGNYVGVRFDDSPADVVNCHPTWEMVYGDLRAVADARPQPVQ